VEIFSDRYIEVKRLNTPAVKRAMMLCLETKKEIALSIPQSLKV
jgi:hypothetical protein